MTDEGNQDLDLTRATFRAAFPAIQWDNQTRKLSELVPWEMNPRLIKQISASRLSKSIDDFGQVETIAIGPDNEVYNGHQRLSVLMQKHGHDYVVDVRVSSRPLTDAERGRLTVYLHESATGQWDYDILANCFDVDDLINWGFEPWKLDMFDGFQTDDQDDDDGPDESEDLPEEEPPIYDGFPLISYPSDNEYGIPVLDLDWQATDLPLPVLKWGARARGKAANAGTIHFYTEDYKMGTLWQKPDLPLNHNPLNLVEPNYTVAGDMPLAMALWQTFRKRWLARYWQSISVSIFVDLNVARCYDDINLIGVPEGWSSYATHGYDDRLHQLDEELDVACRHAAGHLSDIIFIVYGGKQVGDWCKSNAQVGAVWVPTDSHVAEGRYG